MFVTHSSNLSKVIPVHVSKIGGQIEDFFSYNKLRQLHREALVLIFFIIFLKKQIKSKNTVSMGGERGN